jgi:hypothetical protein
LTQSFQPMNSSTSTPAVSMSSPITPTTTRHGAMRPASGRPPRGRLAGSASRARSSRRVGTRRSSPFTWIGPPPAHNVWGTLSVRDQEREAELRRSGRLRRAHGHQTPKPNALWFKIVMFGLMIIGLLWIIVFYISFDKHWPIPSIGNWNILVGFGILMAGFLMTTRWRS